MADEGNRGSVNETALLFDINSGSSDDSLPDIEIEPEERSDMSETPRRVAFIQTAGSNIQDQAPNFSNANVITSNSTTAGISSNTQQPLFPTSLVATQPVFQSGTSPVVNVNLAVTTTNSTVTPCNTFSQARTQHWMSGGTPTVDFQCDKARCNICFDRPVDAFFIPCGHTVCMICGVQIQSLEQPCPTCRVGIARVSQIYN